jgi:hypothetical protein
LPATLLLLFLLLLSCVLLFYGLLASVSAVTGIFPCCATSFAGVLLLLVSLLLLLATFIAGLSAIAGMCPCFSQASFFLGASPADQWLSTSTIVDLKTIFHLFCSIDP